MKLDRGFLDGVPEDPSATNVLLAVIDLMRALHLEFIVEGIEPRVAARPAARERRRVGQGYLLGRPVPAEQLLDRLLASPPSRITPTLTVESRVRSAVE